MYDNEVAATDIIIGQTYRIRNLGTTNWVTLGATAPVSNGDTFLATASGTSSSGTGIATDESAVSAVVGPETVTTTDQVADSANSVEWLDVDDATNQRPANNATVGATLGTDVYDGQAQAYAVGDLLNSNGFFRFTRTSADDNVDAPANAAAFNTAFGRNPTDGDIVVVTNTTSSPNKQAAYQYDGSTFGTISGFFAGDLIIDDTITAAAISVDDLGAINANLGTITGGTLKGGTVPDADAAPSGTESGSFFDLTDGKFVVGNATNNILFDSSALTVTGTVNASAGAFTGDVSTDSKFIAGSGATSATMDGGDQNYKFYAGAATAGASPFKVDASGTVTADRIVITRPNDPSAVIFDSAQDGLVGVGLSSFASGSDTAVAQVADELTSNTDYARTILSATQNLTIKTLFPLGYLPFAINSAEDFPDSITLTLQVANITGGVVGTFANVSLGSKTFTRRTLSGAASDDDYYSVYASGTGWYVGGKDAIDSQFNLVMTKTFVATPADRAYRVQVSYVAGSGSSTANPSSSSSRTLYFNSSSQYFTIDSNDIIRDQAAGSLLTGDVILTASSGSRSISWRDSDTQDETFTIEAKPDINEGGSNTMFIKYNNGTTAPFAFVGDGGNFLITGDFYTGTGAVTAATANISGDINLKAANSDVGINWVDSDDSVRAWSMYANPNQPSTLYIEYNPDGVGTSPGWAFVNNGNFLAAGSIYADGAASNSMQWKTGYDYSQIGHLPLTGGTISENLVITGNLTVNGTTTTVNTDNLTVKDNNITLNYSTGDSSSTANNSGITIQDAVNSTTDASILWKTASDTFEFSHKLTAPNLDVNKNVTTTSANGAFDVSKSLLGNIHITNGAGASGSPKEAAITFQGSGATEAQAGIYVVNDNSTGTHMAFATTNSYSAGPQIAINITNSGVVNFPRARPTYSGSGLWASSDFSSTQITQWDTAYTYSQVGHLPLAGGTLTGALAMGANAITSTGTISSGAITSSQFKGGELGNPQITRNGLTYYVDFNNKACVSGTNAAEVPVDLGPNNYLMSLYGGANFEYKDGIGCYYFDGSDDHIEINNFVVSDTSNSIEIWHYAVAQNGWETWWDSGNERPLLGTNGTNLRAYPNNTNFATINTGKWYHVVWAWASDTDLDVFVNGVRVVEAVNWGNAQRTGTFQAWLGGDTTSETTNGYIAIARAYDRQLTPTDVLQNYNAEVGTFATVTPDLGLIQKGGSVTVPSLQVGSTTVIDSSRNLTNVGTISASGRITSTSNNYAGGIWLSPSSGPAYITANRASDTTGQVGFGWYTGGGMRWVNYLPQDATNTLHWYSATTTTNVMTLDTSGNLNLTSGALRINGIGVIDSSRNLTNIGTISSGAITAPRIIATATGMSEFATNLSQTEDWLNSPITIRERGLVAGNQTGNEYSPNLNFHWSGYMSRSIWMDVGGTFNFGEYGATGIPSKTSGLSVLNAAAYQINNITVIDSSRNMNYIGTISSGAITSTGNSTFSGSIDSGVITSSGNIQTAASLKFTAADPAGWSAPVIFRESAHLALSDYSGVKLGGYNGTSYGPRFHVNGIGNANILEGALQMGGTTVIESNRNLSNVVTATVNTLHIRGENETGYSTPGSMLGGLSLWGAGATTSQMMFKPIGSGSLGNHGFCTDAYNTYFVMDTTNRGWVFRNHSTATNVASISNTGGIAGVTVRASNAFQIGTTEVIDSNRQIFAKRGTQVGQDGTYGGYGVIGFGGITNGYNRVFGNDGTADGLFLAAATGRGIYIRPNGGTADLFGFSPSGQLLVYGIEVLNQSRNLTNIASITASGKILNSSDVVVGNTSGAAYGALSGGQLYFADDDLNDKLAYSIGLKRLENINGNYTKLNIDWHTGITLGASSTYGGVRFFNNSVGYYNSTTKLFSVGEGDSHVRVYNDLKMGSTTVIDASRLLQNVNLQGNAAGARRVTAQWHEDSSGQKRFYFEANSTMYIGSGAGFVFRDSADAGRATISNYGGLNVLSGGDGQVGSNVALAVAGTTVIDASRNITGQEVAASTRLYLNGGSYEGQIVFGAVDAWRVGIRQHDDGDAEMRIWAKNANGRVHIATGYDGQPTSISKPTDGFVVDHNNVGIGNFQTTDPSEKLHVKGNILASGNVTAYSDERLKSDIQTLDGSKVLQMRGVSFTKDGESGSGVIAQEIEKIAPELVHDGEYKSVAYGNLVGYLIENAKQQQSEIDELKTLVKTLMEK